MEARDNRPAGERIAWVEEHVNQLDLEMVRVRGRLHELENDRATIRLMAEQIRQLSDRVTEITHSIPEVARRAAEETIAIVLADREKISAVQESQRRQHRLVAYQALGVGISFGGFVMAVALGVIDHI